MIGPFAVVTTIWFGALWMIWSNKTTLNLFLKIGFFTMFVWALFTSLSVYGFVVKV